MTLIPIAALAARRGLDARHQGRLLFVNPKGRPWYYTTWRRDVWVPACERAGLPGLRFHDLRSNAATAMVAAGVDLKTAQVRLGHASPTLTLGIYARATSTADRRAAEAVGARFRPAPDDPGRAMGAR